MLNRTLRGLDNCLRERLLTGVATSVCQSNFDDLVNEVWLHRLIELGVHYAWFHTYRVVGPKPSPGTTQGASVFRSPESVIRAGAA